MFIQLVRRMFGRIVLGLTIMILGGCIMYYSANLVETFGRSRRADANLGGTRQMWMLIGFAGIVVGGLIMFGIVSFSDPTNINTSSF